MGKIKVYTPPVAAAVLREWYAFPDNVVRVTAGPGGEALLIFGSDKTALLDTGMACFADILLENLHAALQGRPLDYILCSHSHYDHIGAVAAVKKEWPQACTCASAYAQKVFSRPGAIQTMQEMTQVAGQTYLGRTDFAIDFRYMQVDRVLHEGEQLSLGNTAITVLETPGHTNCSLSYVLVPQGILFMSESTGVVNGKGLVESSVLKSYDQAYESIRKCRNYPAKRWVSPHAGLIPAGKEGRYWQLLEKDMADTVQFVQDYPNGKSEDERLEAYVQLTYHQTKGFSQPRAAYALNAKYQLRAAAAYAYAVKNK